MTGQGASFGIDRQAFTLQREWTLPADRARAAAAVEEMSVFVAASRVLNGSEAEIELALQEAVANAVVHGCGNDPAKSVWCWIGCDPIDGVVIVVRDPGPGFDSSRLPNPLSESGLNAAHGRGLYMICSFMDEVRFERGGTELLMRKRPAPLTEL